MQIDPNLNAKVESIVKANSDGEASDNVSIYIGYSLLGLGFLNGITDVPDAFIIGASISGFCFAMIDIITLDGTYKRFIKPLTITGIICLFLLPIILTVYPYPLLIDFFSIYSDMGTFVALGFVLIALGVKSRKAKEEFITVTIEVLRHLIDVNNQIGIEKDEIKREVKNIATEQNEILDDYKRKVVQLEEELADIKEMSSIKNPN